MAKDIFVKHTPDWEAGAMEPQCLHLAVTAYDVGVGQGATHALVATHFDVCM